MRFRSIQKSPEYKGASGLPEKNCILPLPEPDVSFKELYGKKSFSVLTHPGEDVPTCTANDGIL